MDEQEVIRWFEEGKTYAWMVEEYRRKYNIETVSSMWGNFRRRRGLTRRITRNDELIPWAVQPQHRWAYSVQMLRSEARRREGKPLREIERLRLEAFLRGLEQDNAVIHYDPETDEGFFRVPREVHDEDIIRRPTEGLSQRRAAD